jgi:tetratricopeptide (TPR) repeat protein
MANLSSDPGAVHPAPDSWRHDNERGLALASDGDWAEASEAFAAAADGLARVLPSETRGVHEPLALVLSNLAHANFRLGRLEEALQQAQRSCVLRVALAGEDALPVARAHMDLAVMLATAGRFDEATALVQRAMSSMEHRVGEEDARMAIVLENAARIALAGGHPANAEPLLLRLHALLDHHELSTARAEQLLARVAEARGHAAAPSAPDALPVIEDAAAIHEYAHASIAAEELWEDQPLRDAVAVTDVLLRTTPSGVPTIPATTPIEPPRLDASALDDDGADALLDIGTPTSILPSLHESDDSALASLSLELVFDEAEPSGETQDDVLLDVPFVSTEMADPVADRPLDESPLSGLSLDFTVDHGLSDVAEPLLEGPPISTPVPQAIPEEPRDLGLVPVTEIITSGPTTGIAPIDGIVQTAPLMAEARIADAPLADARLADAPVPATPVPVPPPSPRPTTRPATPNDQRPVRRSAEPRAVPPKKVAPKKGNGGTVALVIGALAIAGGAAAYFLLLR